MQRVRVSSYHAPVQRLGDPQMTLLPMFRLAAAQSSFSGEHGGKPLIPGLPDDIALNCLLQLPVESHPACRAVCKRWNMLLGTKERFFSRRKELGFRDPWLFVTAFHKCTEKIQWQVLDLTRYTWHTIPPMPCKEPIPPRGFMCVSMPNEGNLLVLGGVVPNRDSPLNLVLKYEIYKNRWSVMSPMITARSFFGSGVINGLVYAVGGNSADLYELDLAEVLDPVKWYWHPIARMGTNIAAYDAAVLNGKLFVTEGWLWPFMFSPRGQVYDPKSNNWEVMSVGMREGWTGSSVVIDGNLFVVSDHERMKLKVYDAKTDSWVAVSGSPVPHQICKPFSVSSNGSTIYIVGSDLHVAIGQLKKLNCKCDFHQVPAYFVRWEVVDVPETFYDLTPSNSQVLFA
ncbi:hypothetical protein GIB67_002682 [Kingdonia uniflora]|uniref:F-box domain-containing protein n=1 Tax=Kingdonia uniflora TaxID=39325 RepID=A0A7J7LJW0_9MAGN|nr:hypothetical protein GIB67_002682 [Kingdonia uniflora]